MATNYKQVLLERLKMLNEDVKRDITDFLHSIRDYSFTTIEVSLKGWYTTRLYEKGTTYDYDKSVEMEIVPNRAVGGQDIKQITLKEPQSQRIIDRVDEAVEKQFPTFKRSSGNIDGFIRWEDDKNAPKQDDEPKQDERRPDPFDRQSDTDLG